jgi:hypothetical protein
MVSVVAVLVALLRLVAGWFYWFDESGLSVPSDLQIYQEAATNLRLRQSLYVDGGLPVDTWFYEYPPAYALVFTPFLWLPSIVVICLLMVLHVLAYGLLYVRWSQIFRRLDSDRLNETLVWTLPVWLLFSSFWHWFTYLNIGVFVALVTTLLVESILDESLGWSVLWLSVILQTKPPWASVIAIALLLGRRRFFLQLVVFAAMVYIAFAGATVLVTGPSYGCEQYVKYLQQLWNYRSNWPWRGPEAPFLGYNHSITQIIVYLLGVTSTTLHLATVVKILLLVPLGVVGLRYLFRPVEPAHPESLSLGLDFAFALYLGTYIWLDVFYEAFLSIATLPYLVATVNRLRTRIWIWVAFLAYALAEVWLLVAGAGPISDDGYALLNPSIHIPLVAVVVLTFYVLLIRRLWLASTWGYGGKTAASVEIG